MTLVNVLTNVIVIPILIVIIAVWCAIMAGIVKSGVFDAFTSLHSKTQVEPFDIRRFVREILSCIQSCEFTRAFCTFYRKPAEGILAWICIIVIAFWLMALWAVLIETTFGG